MTDLPELTVLPVANPAAEIVAVTDAPNQISLTMRVANLIAVILPFAGLLAAIVALWGWGFHWADLGLLIGMYLLTALGITVGFHRLFTHKSFETNRVVQFILGVLGSMAVQGPVLEWVAMHRRHHQHSDDPEDPHSPHHQGGGVKGILLGIWHAHLGWIFQPHPRDLPRYVTDLQHNSAVRRVSALFPVWVAAGLLIPAALGGVTDANLDGRLKWTCLGWARPGVFGAPRYVERQFHLPFVGKAAFPQSRSKPK